MIEKPTCSGNGVVFSDDCAQLLTRHDVAEWFRVSIHTIDNLCKFRGLPFLKFGGNVRFLYSDVADWLRSQARLATEINDL
ncbi:MAG: helix-turn-helix domain-containing protein [Planctomycetia bacterium]|nr:helix-turn-helix domain-containing protein [Planctomycetia bacterium]